MLRGLRPFIATGPMFKRWVLPGSLSRLGRWLVRSDLLESVRSAFPVGRTHCDDRLALAEILLADGIVQALWVNSDGTHLSPESRLASTLDEVAREVVGSFKGELSDSFDMSAELSWGLATLPGPEFVRSYVAEDGLSVEAMDFSAPRA